MPNEDKLKNKLKEALAESQIRTATDRIWDKAGKTLGSDSFVYREEAKVLAIVDEANLRRFVEEVMAIRRQVAEEYKDAIVALATDTDKEEA